MRGHKYDHYETEKARKAGKLKDKRSFIGRRLDMSLHELLAGEDKQRRYTEIVDRAKGQCQGCESPHYIGEKGEWDHIQSGLTGRCDCLHNGRWVCIAFHRKRHPSTQWSKK